jgi:hypothetical protein
VKPEPSSTSSSSSSGTTAKQKKTKKATAVKGAKKETKHKAPKKKVAPGRDLRSSASKQASAAALQRSKAEAAQERATSTGGRRKREVADNTVGTRYRIEPAKSGRGECKVTKQVIPKGKLRFGVYRDGVLYGGWCLLEATTPERVRNAILHHEGITSIGNFAALTQKEQM